MSNQHTGTRFTCLFFGMPCAFSSPILTALARPDIELVGVVTPNSYGGPEPYRVLPSRAQTPTLPMADRSGQFRAPRFLVRDIRDARLQVKLRELEPDLIVVACFPWRIPPPLIEHARIAALNIHPSLLPRHRGPDPLFWTFRTADTQAGVTLHRLTNTFDAGDILVQESTQIAPAESLAALEQRLARLGANLLGQLLSGLPALPSPTSQDNALATSEPAPACADLEIDSCWTVDRARRFVAGVARSHGPLTYRHEGRSLPVFGLADGASGIEIPLRDGHLRVDSGDLGDKLRVASF